MDKIYAFLLDFFPLVEEISSQNAVLGATLQHMVLQTFLYEVDRRYLQEDVERLKTMLCLSRDLGYVSPEVIDFLIARIP